MWVVDAATAVAFVERVFDPARIRPLVLVSTSHRVGDRPLLDADALREQAGELAEIAVMADDAASWTLSKHLDKLSAWGGAVRVYLPDATRADPWQRHPLIQVAPARPRVALGQITAHLRSAADMPARTPAPLTVVPAPGAEDESARQDRGDAVRREAELDRFAAHLADRERLLREKDAVIADLRQQVRKLTKQLRTARESAGPELVAVYADPARQFCHEVEQRWLTTVSEAEREQRPLAPYRLGRDWMSSLEAIELVDRSKILDVVVEVLTGRVVDNVARRVRRMRSSDGGGTAPRVRDDGAKAWRCDIKQRAASAPRLMWWRLPDNIVELGRVAAHDDMQLR
ncbi:hypothetical protein [Streptomyces sp. NPDC127039]|uniref:hypothetical protein n=1 Tax=Streptomyces sp. NPDC127039 TaxID=3347115 RepID=UPI00365CD9DB